MRAWAAAVINTILQDYDIGQRSAAAQAAERVHREFAAAIVALGRCARRHCSKKGSTTVKRTELPGIICSAVQPTFESHHGRSIGIAGGHEAISLEIAPNIRAGSRLAARAILNCLKMIAPLGPTGSAHRYRYN
jgi:hypothetical protein